MANDPHAPLVVAGWDGSARGRDALVLAALLARERGARMAVIHAHADYSRYPLAREAAAEVARATDEALERVPRELLEGLDADVRAVTGYAPAEALQHEAARLHAELLVVGSTHHGPLGRVLPGSVGENLLHGSPCAVAIAPAGYAGRPERGLQVVGVAFDGSDESTSAVRGAAEIARRAGARLRLVAVVEPRGYGWAGIGTGWVYVDLPELRRQYYERALPELARDLSDLEVETEIRDGAPAAELRTAAEKGMDLLVMGSRGYGPIRRVLVGSVAVEVLRSAPCPVMVLPRGTQAGVEDATEAPAAASARAVP